MRSQSTTRSRVIGSSTSLLLTAGCATDSETKTNLFFLGRNAQALVFSAVYTRKNAIERGNTVLKLAVLGGDGTGPEVVAEGLKVLDAISKKNGFEYSTEDFDFGGERYMKTGEVLPEGAVETLSGFDAIYLGAVGHPDVAPGILEKGLLLELRFQLQQYINLRPVKLYEGVECPLKDKGPELSLIHI